MTTNVFDLSVTLTFDLPPPSVVQVASAKRHRLDLSISVHSRFMAKTYVFDT